MHWTGGLRRAGVTTQRQMELLIALWLVALGLPALGAGRGWLSQIRLWRLGSGSNHCALYRNGLLPASIVLIDYGYCRRVRCREEVGASPALPAKAQGRRAAPARARPGFEPRHPWLSAGESNR